MGSPGVIARRIIAATNLHRADIMDDISSLAWGVYEDTGRVLTPSEAARQLKRKGPRGGWPLDLLDSWPPG